MESLTQLMNKGHRAELILVILMVIYLIMGLKTPDVVANIVDTIVGKVVIILVVGYLFIHANPILAVLAALVAFDLMRRASQATGIDALKKYMPSEEKKTSQFTAFNQFPYTLEQEVVAKMAPIVRTGSPLSHASYKPMLNNIYDASPLIETNVNVSN
jgi:hypothetical protein